MTGPYDLLLDEVRALLAERIGLNPESLGQTLLRNAVADHLQSLRLPDDGDYGRMLQNWSTFDDLVERVIVPETWFFRDLEPYRCLQQFVRDTWRAADHGRPLRILSVPCSSGEEPYSLAMTLLDLGLGAGDFEIHAVDIARSNLERARMACYGRNSFREKSTVMSQPLETFFRQEADQWHLHDVVRQQVRFRRANLASADFLPIDEPFDVILCRNLLIYFVPEAKARATSHFERLLRPAGFLYLGHAESGVAVDSKLVPHDRRFPFAYRFRREQSRNTVPAEPAGTAATPSRDAPGPAAAAVRASLSAASILAGTSNPVPPLAGISKPLPPPQPGPPASPLRTREIQAAPPALKAPIIDTAARLSAARDAANAGRLEDAVRICEELLEEPDAGPDVYCLMGTVRQAAGDFSEAERCFHKAAYLDPRHHESLVHLSLLAQRRGDALAAENFRRRALRSAAAE